MSNAHRARNTQSKGMTMKEYANWNREQTANHRNLNVQHSHRLTQDKVAQKKGIQGNGNTPARVIAQRQLIQNQKEAGIKRKRDKTQEAIRQDELAIEKGFPNGTKFNSFVAGFFSLRKYKDKLMYRSSFYNYYPEDTTIGQFLRSKPDGRIHSFKGKNMNRIVHAAIADTIPDHPVSERAWLSLGERMRYKEMPEASAIHRNISISHIMSYYDH